MKHHPLKCGGALEDIIFVLSRESCPLHELRKLRSLVALKMEAIYSSEKIGSCQIHMVQSPTRHLSLLRMIFIDLSTSFQADFKK
jgi:hypothetical protein